MRGAPGQRVPVPRAAEGAGGGSCVRSARAVEARRRLGSTAAPVCHKSQGECRHNRNNAVAEAVLRVDDNRRATLVPLGEGDCSLQSEAQASAASIGTSEHERCATLRRRFFARTRWAEGRATC